MGFISVILAANTEVNSLSVLKQKPSLSSTLLTYSHITHLLLVIHVVYFLLLFKCRHFSHDDLVRQTKRTA